MSQVVKDLRTVRRIQTDLFAHIKYSKGMTIARILNLSCWGAKIRVSEILPLYEIQKIKFIFHAEYTIMFEIVERLSEYEYRIKFIFQDLHQKEMLQRHII